MKRRELTEEEKQEAVRLATSWENYKKEHAGATQTWLGAESKIGSQGVVGQYLRGVIPLNIKALVAICRTIGVDPRTISPRLANTMDGLIGGAKAQDTNASGGLADSLKLTCETASELRLLTVYRLLDKKGKLAFDHFTQTMVETIRSDDKMKVGPP